MNRPNQFQFEWITDWDTVYSEYFQQQWLDWHNASEANHVFFHPALCMAWIATYRPLRDIEPLFCVARKNDLLIFIPLIYWKRNWKNAFQRLIVPVGYSDFDYHDPLCIGLPQKNEIDRFWFEVNRELKKRIKFEKLVIDGLHKQWISPDMTIISTERCPHIRLTDINSAEEFKQTLPIKLRHDLSRRMRRLRELGDVEFKIFEKTESKEALSELEEFLQFHTERWPQAYKAPEFHLHLLEDCLSKGVLHFSVIRFRGKSISWRLNFADKSRFYSYMPAIDPDYQQFSPGKLHLLLCIEDAISKGIAVYDQLRGNESYKNEWTNHSDDVYTVEWSKKSNAELLNNLFTDTKELLSQLRASGKKTKKSVTHKTSTWQFEWITDWEAIYAADFQQQWKEWYDKAELSHVFIHPAMAMVWIDTYKPIRNLKPLFCIARNKDLVLFFPMVKWKRNWKNAFQRMIIPVGYADFDYHDPLVTGAGKYNSDRFYAELIEEIKKTQWFDKIHLRGIRTRVNHPGWTEESDYCPYCNLTEFKSSTDFINSLKTGLRGDLNRQIRRMSEKGVITLHSYNSGSIDEALKTLKHFLNLHKKRWPKAYKAPHFHKLLLEYGFANAVVDFTELRVGNTAVSWHLGFKEKDRYYYYMPVIQPEFASLSPGKIHLLYLVNKAIEEKINIFDHLRGDENYKTGWTNNVQYLFQYKETTSKNSGIIRNWLAKTVQKINR